MGVMKRLYTLHGKGLPTDSPTVLRRRNKRNDGQFPNTQGG